MKKFLTAAAFFLVSVLFLSACGKSELTMKENTAKRMVVSAVNADPGDFFAVGTLSAEEGEAVVITSQLEKGDLQIDLSASSLISFNAGGNETHRQEITPGDYMLKVTCGKKATGTVAIELVPASEVQ